MPSHYMPHPYRVYHHPMIDAVREQIRQDQVTKAIAAGGQHKTWKEQKTIMDWSEKTEVVVMDEDRRDWHQHRMRSHIRTLSDAFLQPDDRETLTEPPRIYDIRDLMDKFPNQSVSDFKLGDLILSRDKYLNGMLYIEFGRKDERFAIDADRDLYFEGAYVRLSETEKTEMTEVTVDLVVNDPNFDNWENQSYFKSIERMANSVSLVVREGMTVYEGFQTLAGNHEFFGDASLRQSHRACFNAYDTTIKTLLYIYEYRLNADIGFYSKERPDLITNWINKKPSSLYALLESGLTPVYFLGRQIEPLPPFFEPNLVSHLKRDRLRLDAEYEEYQASVPGM